LDETYSRILNNIPEKYRKIAHCVMQILAVSHRPLTLEEMAEAVAVDYENEKFHPVLHRLRDPSYVLKICPSLVTARLDAYSLSCAV
jgi:TATA-box binding protein (TBP) (component of TFIID and TFIIIB)